MQPVLILINNVNYLVQQIYANSQQVRIRIDTSDTNQNTTYAELFKLADGSWAYTIQERKGVWGRASSVFDSKAICQEEALEDMLYHIRQCNYLSQGV